ncbi:hypothetical protein [Streptomyces sp. NRRL S-920]|uniref:hypothetical protein n=1 Tax=Streptomyces sp. NRRL S-920 TaxID=1463921 RepID=UPI00131AC7D7|nr:hypothetical protein [Streptomyces sp. NRRL S-920]
MLGPDLPRHPPVGTAAREGFVRSALALALHVRAHSWAEKDLGPVGVPGREDVPHPGERGAAEAFDALGRLLLPNASPEGWAATLVTDLARGDETLETAVKVGKYIQDFQPESRRRARARLAVGLGSAVGRRTSTCPSASGDGCLDRQQELRTLAGGIRRERAAAVLAALNTTPRSGAVEGNVTRIDLLKRQMCGRANCDLLRRRPLLSP